MYSSRKRQDNPESGSETASVFSSLQLSPMRIGQWEHQVWGIVSVRDDQKKKKTGANNQDPRKMGRKGEVS